MDPIPKYPWGKGRIVWTRDATANDSDKSFTVPTGKIWELFAVEASIITTANAGNRSLRLTITDGTNLLLIPRYSASIAASKRGFARWHSDYGYAHTDAATYTLNDGGAAADVAVHDWLPTKCYLPAGYVVRVYDSNAVDAAADDLTVVLHYIEYDA
jgi:hypothetical protein